MTKYRWIVASLVILTVFMTIAGSSMAQEDPVVEVQKYNRAIHIMFMLLIGFGFLMAFVRGYGKSALTATLLLVSVGIPIYILISSLGIFGHVDVDIDRLILAEFATASLLICAGAVLGRLKMPQYMLMGALFIPFYMFNEWILLDGGLGIIQAGAIADTGGSIVIHAFGALFGLGVIMTMTTKREFFADIPTDATSDRFSLLGTMALWIFWPSFCAALVPVEHVPQTAINVILALCGSTLATYFATIALRRKIAVADIANATLAGGVAIGATCDYASMPVAILIGVLAGTLSTYGYAKLQPILHEKLKGIDTCGVSNLHGMPGIMGGVAAIFVVAGLDPASQLIGIGITIGIAIGAGWLVGQILAYFGTRLLPYDDSEEFLDD